MKLYRTRLLTPREQHQSQYFTVTVNGAEVCRTDSVGKAERVARALALLEQVEALETGLEAGPADADPPDATDPPRLVTAAD